jgi:hypothetical protein
MTQEEAVASAKRIAVKLRKLAEYDQNRKYILFKTGELENQIYLEEEGLLLEKEQYRQKSANDLIPLFNAELGKQRPDFKNLWSIQKQMAASTRTWPSTWRIPSVNAPPRLRKRCRGFLKQSLRR